MTHPMRIIETTADLETLSAELARGDYVALDTEFMRDQTYWPKLCLIQAASHDVEAIIDPLAEGIDLTPFHKLLANKKVVKVFHAARQDIEIFFHQGKVIPEPLFDSQIAAMVCGFGEAASYETLARRIVKTEIDKSARFTDWSKRPLSKRQLEYALADVTHLRVIYEFLSKEMERTGRGAWVADELGILTNPRTYQLEPSEAWRRLRARSTNKRFLTVLVALAAWREREAQTRNVPRARILKDEALLEIAAHPPPTSEALAEIRALPRGYAASRQGKDLMSAITAGLEGPPPDDLTMDEPRRRSGREPSAAALDLLKTLLRLRANENGVAPRLIANADDLERLAAGDDDGVAAMSGWRADVFGNDAKALREGRLAIALERGEAVVIEAGHAPKAHAKAR
jgi:ribonuclease D